VMWLMPTWTCMAMARMWLASLGQRTTVSDPATAAAAE
jgi:hypothetical protein